MCLQRVAKLSPTQWAQLCKLRLLVGTDLERLKRQRWQHISAIVVGAPRLMRPLCMCREVSLVLCQ